MPLEDGLGKSGKWIDPVGHAGRIDANDHMGHIFHWTAVEMSSLGSGPGGSVVVVPERPMKVTWSVSVVKER